MFNLLYKCPRAVARHSSAPLADERLRYLTYRAEQGFNHSTLRHLAAFLLVINEQLDLHADGEISLADIEAVAHRWASHSRHHSFAGPRLMSAYFISHATKWLRFLGRLPEPVSSPHPDAHILQEFADYMQREKGLSPQTVHNRRRFVGDFLSLFPTQRPLTEISITHIDEVLAQKSSQDHYSRRSIQLYVDSLRAFFRFAELRGWCTSGLAEAMLAPRVFKEETLPAGPSWSDVRRLLATTEGDRPIDIRDRAILLLFTVYGLRAGEVHKLRLEDLDWEKEVISVTRPKPRLTQQYPLSPTVGEAISRYLKEVRRRTPYRELFLTSSAPVRPLTRGALSSVVINRLRPLGVSLKHYGPHSLRHACATHLLAEGFSLKAIGDHLGHRSPDATRIYAKVDIAGLREVAAFDLGGL